MALDGKYVTDSQVSLSLLMGAQDANTLGNVHGGVIMKLADEAGALCAMRHAQRPVVTVAIDSMTFMKPVNVGYLVMLQAELIHTGRTSMQVGVRVIAENPITGEQSLSNTAHIIYVALGEDLRPVEVPPLILETDEQRHAFELASKRKEFLQEYADKSRP